MRFHFMVIILLHNGHQHVSATHEAIFQGGEIKNTNSIIKCLNQSTV